MLTGVALLVDRINYIIDHPETWDQRQYHCGSTHCIAGHCQIAGGRAGNTFTDAKELIGLSEGDAKWLFSSNRTLKQIRDFGYMLLHPEEYVDGFDRAGFDRAGFDRDGFDRAGRDRAGFDRAGFDRAGRDRAGRDRAGRDRDGRDRDGFDRDGRDRDGFDRDGFDRAGQKLEKIT